MGTDGDLIAGQWPQTRLNTWSEMSWFRLVFWLTRRTTSSWRPKPDVKKLIEMTWWILRWFWGKPLEGNTDDRWSGMHTQKEVQKHTRNSEGGKTLRHRMPDIQLLNSAGWWAPRALAGAAGSSALHDRHLQTLVEAPGRSSQKGEAGKTKIYTHRLLTGGKM